MVVFHGFLYVYQRENPIKSHETVIFLWFFPIENGDFPIEQGDFPLKHGEFRFNIPQEDSEPRFLNRSQEPPAVVRAQGHEQGGDGGFGCSAAKHGGFSPRRMVVSTAKMAN